MTFTPIFIPMSGGGGGGGPIWPIIVINAVLIGGVVKLWDYSFNPTFHLELKPSYYTTSLYLKKRNCPNIQKIIHLNTEKKDIRDFVDNYFLARDSRAFREHIKNTQPDVNLNVTLDSGEEVAIPIGLSFFWPDYN